jgi:hypothetical protein
LKKFKNVTNITAKKSTATVQLISVLSLTYKIKYYKIISRLFSKKPEGEKTHRTIRHATALFSEH